MSSATEFLARRPPLGPATAGRPSRQPRPKMRQALFLHGSCLRSLGRTAEAIEDLALAGKPKSLVRVLVEA